MKKKKPLLLMILLAGLFIAPVCYADMVPMGVPFFDSPIATLIVYFLINIAVELFFGWLLFFKSNKKALYIVLLANIISQPIAVFLFAYSGNVIETLDFSLINLLAIPASLLLIEILVVVFEMFLYKFTINEMTYYNAFNISLSLNVLSFFLGIILFIFLLMIGGYVNDIGGFHNF